VLCLAAALVHGAAAIQQVVMLLLLFCLPLLTWVRTCSTGLHAASAACPPQHRCYCLHAAATDDRCCCPHPALPLLFNCWNKLALLRLSD
jgi:hypothetical protein